MFSTYAMQLRRGCDHKVPKASTPSKGSTTSRMLCYNSSIATILILYISATTIIQLFYSYYTLFYNSYTGLTKLFYIYYITLFNSSNYFTTLLQPLYTILQLLYNSYITLLQLFYIYYTIAFNSSNTVLQLFCSYCTTFRQLLYTVQRYL